MDKDPLDVDLALERLSRALPLQLRSAAAYTIAASYEIARWLAWPAYRGVVATPDPYASFVELWRHGVGWARSATRVLAWVEPS